MRDLCRQAALLADLDRLAHAVGDTRRLVAHVRDVDAAHAAGHPRELDDFGGRRERPRHVEQSGAQSERAVLHALLHERAHPVELRRRRFAIGRTDHLIAHRSLADEHREVRRDARGRHAIEKRPQRNRRPAVRSLEDRRHTLPHVVVRGRHLEDAAARVRMEIDEAGRNDFPGGIDNARRRRVDPRRDARDGVAANRDVSTVPGTARSVDDAAVADDQIEGRRLRARRGEHRRGERQCRSEKK